MLGSQFKVKTKSEKKQIKQECNGIQVEESTIL